MLLTDVTLDEARVLAWGARAAVAISSPFPGVLRVRSAPQSAATGYAHPELPEKRSFAVVGDYARPIASRREGDAILIETEGAALTLALNGGTWVFRDGEGRLLAESQSVTGSARSSFPADLYRSELRLAAPPGEAYLGFGEKVGPVDKRGMRFIFWNTDNFPPQPETDPLYVSIPFFLALRDGIAWGMFLDETWRSEVDIARADRSVLAWETTGPELDLYLIAGPRPEDVIRSYVELTGKPAMAPLWSLGAHQSRWGYENAETVRGVVRGYRAHGLPLDVVHLDIDYMDGYKVWTWDKSRYPDPVALAREVAENGVRLVTIVDPGIKLEPGYAVYDEALANDYLVRLERGGVLVGEVWPEPAVFPDLSRPEVQHWWGDQHEWALENGIAGIWNDMNEPACFSVRPGPGIPSPEGGKQLPGASAPLGATLPDEARHGARRHLEVHNVYALGMARAAFEGLSRGAPDRRPFVLTRAAFAGVQRYAAVWTGDFGSHWGHLEASLPMLAGLGVSGVPFVGADVGGFLRSSDGELCTRWTQAGIFYPFCRNHSAKGTAQQEPWRFGEPFLSIMRAALLLRYRLLPTLYTLMREAAETGMPVLRPVAFAAPGDRAALSAFDEVLFGPDLLVAPVVRPQQDKRLVYLPEGAWLPLPNLDASGAAAPLQGGRHIIAEAPLEVVPTYLRAGGALALTAPAMHTTTASWAELTWHVHAGDSVRASLYEDAGDGAGPSRVTRIEGGFTKDGKHFELVRRAEGDLPLARTSEVLCLYGPWDGLSPLAVRGARFTRADAGLLTLEVAADWDRIEIDLG